ncbi:MAG: DUF3352 domain-containing protein [Sphaerospermopsis sp. SIO1G2]|nr:DUF3352 domain-containing protein [Sphaerospermopsis sp. SIO1G1]NET72297.1 DUF3352 domain-containing protein [Sphaerospermopsis sp. SIO1G2]
MPENISNRKSKFLVPAISAAIVIAGGIAAYLYFKTTDDDSLTAMSSAKLVPANALMATYIKTDTDSWNELQQFGTEQAQDLVKKRLQDFQQDFFSGSDVSYETDIQSWIGGVMIAVLPEHESDSTQENISSQTQQESNVLLIIGIKDKINALNFANKLKQQKDSQIEESEYKGQTIFTNQSNNQPTYVAILNNSHILLAPTQKAVEKAIDTYKGEASFATKEGANSLLSKGVDLDNTLVQIYLPDHANVIQQLAALNPQSPQLQSQTIEQLKQVKSMVAGIGVDDSGLRFKTIINLDPQLSKLNYQSSPGKIVSKFPNQTIALLTGQDISKSWQAFLEESKQTPEIQQGVEQARKQLKTFTNLDLDQDIFSWMNGEFALGAVQSDQGLLENVGFGGAIILDTSDRKTAEATLKKLDNLAKEQSLNVKQKTIAGKNITEWEIPFQGPLIAHGWLDQDTVFLALGSPIAETIANSQGKSLDQSDRFKTITGSLEKPNGGYFYLDMEKATSVINNFVTANQPLPADVNAILQSINGFGVTVNSPNQSIIQMEMLLSLKEGNSQ